ncbi:hypothetical protein [Amphibiibacter pelophylacis]|uniref:Uncharacterized protein n=1 Tax=Amphibiibacter pelophylacis TaxID=1799477 RepID=A0ACC6P4C5_9BURK
MNPSVWTVDRPVLLFVMALVSLPLYIWIGRWVFDDWEDFLESLRYLYQPQWLSALRGEWHEDNWGSIKFLCFLILCATIATGLYKLAKLLF